MDSNDKITSIFVSRQVPVGGWPLGFLRIEAFWLPSGASTSALLNVSVIADPMPKLTSSYPDVGSCGDRIVVHVKVAHLPPLVDKSWIEATLLDADNRAN